MTAVKTALSPALSFEALIASWNLTVIEVLATSFSGIIGKHLQSIALPEQTRVLYVARQNRLIMDFDAFFIEEGDRLFFLTANPEDKITLTSKLGVVNMKEHRREESFV